MKQHDVEYYTNLLQQHTEERDTLASMKVSDMTLGEAVERMDRIRYLNDCIYSTSQLLQYTLIRPRGIEYNCEPVQKKDTERNLGRYVMVVLASFLCMLAVIVFALSFWPLLPAFVQFALILCAGIGLWIVGFIFARKKKLRAFWLGISSLGSGIVFLVSILGTLVWELYGIELAGPMLWFWFVANYYLAYHIDFYLNYIITYIGGLLGIVLSCAIADMEIMVIAATAAVVLVGEVGYLRADKSKLHLINLIFCWAVSIILWVYSSIEDVVILPYIQAAIAALCMYECSHFENKSVTAGSVLWSSILLYNAVSGWIRIAMVGAVFAVVVAIHAPGFLLGMAPVAAVALYQTVPIIPVLVAAVLFVIPGILEERHNRAGAVVFYLLSICFLLYSSLDTIAGGVSCIVSLGVLILYTRRVLINKLFFCEYVDKMFLVILPGVILGMLDISVALPAVFSYTSFELYSTFYLHNRDVPRGAWTVHNITSVLLYLRVFAVLPLTLSIFDRAILTATLVACCACSLYKATAYRSNLHNIAACAISNLHLFLLFEIWDVAELRMLVSICGLLMAFGFVALGFWKADKSIRKCGLVCAILYVAKLVLLDFNLEFGPGSAVILLFAGVVCFCISMVYNKLDEAYGSEV